MRNHVVGICCTLMGMTLALMEAPAARADNEHFVAEANALGFTQWDDVLIRMGLSACRFLQPQLRRTPEDVVERIARYANVEADRAHQFLVLSVNEYCPQHAYRLGGLRTLSILGE